MVVARAFNKDFLYKCAVPASGKPKWWIYMDVALVRGRLECVRFMIEPDKGHGEPITTTVLRSLAMPALLERLATTMRYSIEAAGSADTLLPPEGSRRGRPLERDPREVARVYTAALAVRQPPTRAVEKHFGISYAAAAKAVHTARARGHLPPTRQGLPAAESTGTASS
jgi:hypothetical protein